MKKALISCLSIACTLTATLALSTACSGGDSTPKNYNADIQAVAPEDITAEHFVVEDGKTYYTSPGLSLWMEVNGHFLERDYFSLDGNKRVYDSLHFYQGDYFYMNSNDSFDLYASLLDSTDTQYAEEEKESGYDIQLNVKKSGIYTLIFDMDTLKFDIEYKSEIETPVYYTMKNCSIYSKATSWVEMNANPDNEEEFVIRNFNVEAGESISFFSHIHTSNYKVTLSENNRETYASANKTLVYLNVGGNYDIYVNKTTYVVRLELLNPDTASYSCVYYDGSAFHTLQPYDANVPYIFRQQITVEKYDSLPKFHTQNYKTYILTVVDTADVLMGNEKNFYFKQAGTYDIIINLKAFEITAEVSPE